MKYFLIIIFLLRVSLSGQCQLQTYDLVSHENLSEEKPSVIYFTGLWCKPCMKKLKELTDTFSLRKDINFIVLFDRSGMNEKTVNLLANRYDTSFFKVLPERYYKVPNSKRIITIGVRGSDKPIKEFVLDINQAFRASYTTNEIWVGVSFFLNDNTFYVLKESEGNLLNDEVNAMMTTGR